MNIVQRAKKWKLSVKVKGTTLMLEKWIAEFNAHGFNPMKLGKEQLLSFLQDGLRIGTTTK